MSMYRRRLMIANALKKSSGINYPGLIAAWSAKGKTNDDEDRAILKDLTGNGHDITLNGFAFSEMSGYGGYKLNLTTTDIKGNQLISQTITHNKIILEKLIFDNEIAWINGQKITTIPKLSWKVSNVKQFIDRYPDSYVKIDDLSIVEDGVYTIEEKPEGYSHYWLSVAKTSDMGTISLDNPIDIGGIEIELLPEYPDALVFDGVDDYGRSIDKIKALTEYTVILKRNIIKPIEYAASFYKGEGSDDVNSNFFIEYYERSKWYYGNGSSSKEIKYYDENIIYITEKSYNGLTVDIDFRNVVDNPVYLGKITGNWCHNMVFYSAYLFDRSLDEQEIKAFIRKYIDPDYYLPSEVVTPDCYYDFSLGSNDDENRETIKDQSGNGNDAKAYNIAWNEEGSGYKDGALYLDGIDDYIALEAFDSGFKTVFMVFNPIVMADIAYDQRSNDMLRYFSIFLDPNTKAYAYRAEKTVTYVNGIINTTLIGSNLSNKKQCITMLLDDTIQLGGNTKTPIIGAHYNYRTFFSKIVLYKFLGFKEELTEEQIKAIIKKYNLLDGVDEIEVS